MMNKSLKSLVEGCLLMVLCAIFPGVSVADDTSPPELVAFDFNPTSIDTSSGSQEVTFAIEFADDLSGFRNGHLRVRGPSGQWLELHFSGQGELGGTYIVVGTFPQHSEAGTWIVYDVILNDMVDNEGHSPTAELAARGFVTTIEVVSGLDTTAPQLLSFEFNPFFIDTSEGPATVTFSIDITDDLSGFSHGYLRVRSVSNQWVQLRFTGQGELSDTFTVSTTFPQYCEAGTWIVYSVILNDMVGNEGYYSTEALEGMGFDATIQVTSVQDLIAPELVAFDFYPKAIDTSKTSQTVTFVLQLTDNLSGFSHGWIRVRSPSVYQWQAPYFFGPGNSSGEWVVDCVFPQYCETGVWTIYDVILNDQVGNESHYGSAELANLGFPNELFVGVPLTPLEKMDCIIEFADAAVASGSLYGVGPGKSASGRLQAFSNMLGSARDYVAAEDFAAAHDQLAAALRRCDGLSPPPDFIEGPSREELAALITELMSDLL